MKPQEIKKLIMKSAERERNFIAHCKTGSQRDNPQVVALRVNSEGRLEALEAVLRAFNDDAFELKTLAGE